MPESLSPDESFAISEAGLVGMDSPSAPVRLRRVALPLEGSERFQWRLAGVLIALSVCRGNSATVEQLHTLVWAINDSANASALRDAWEGGRPLAPTRGYVGGLLQTLRVAQAEGLVEQQANGRQKLTDAGMAFVAKMRESDIRLGFGDRMLAELSPISSAEMTRRLGGRPG